MIKYMAIILSIILLSSIQVASADWIDYMSWTLTTNEVLNVCIYEPEEEKLKEYEDEILGGALLAIDNWNEQLKGYGDNYEIETIYISETMHKDKIISDFLYCNVHITFWVDRLDDEQVLDSALGITWNFGRMMDRDMTIIEVYPILVREFAIVESGKSYTTEELEAITIESEIFIDSSGVYSVVLHEFGHAIGLGHLCQEPYGYKMTSAMVPQFDVFTEILEISGYDLAAIYVKYGPDGWAGDTNFIQDKYGAPSPLFDDIARCT